MFRIITFFILLVSFSQNLLAASEQPKWWYEKSQRSFDAKNYDLALEQIEQAQKVLSDNPDFHYHHARIYSKLVNNAGFFSLSGYLKNMRHHLEKVVLLDPKHIKANQLLVDLYSTLPNSLGGARKKALDTATHLSTLDNIEGQIAKAKIDKHAKNYDSSIQRLQQAIQKAPNTNKIHFLLAGLYEKKDKPQQAVEHYLKYVENIQEPDEIEEILAKIKRYTKDTPQFNIAIETLLNKMLLVYKSDQKKLAKTYFTLIDLQLLQNKVAEAKLTLLAAQKQLTSNKKWQRRIAKKLKQL